MSVPFTLFLDTAVTMRVINLLYLNGTKVNHLIDSPRTLLSPSCLGKSLLVLLFTNTLFVSPHCQIMYILILSLLIQLVGVLEAIFLDETSLGLNVSNITLSFANQSKTIPFDLVHQMERLIPLVFSVVGRDMVNRMIQNMLTSLVNVTCIETTPLIPTIPIYEDLIPLDKTNANLAMIDFFFNDLIVFFISQS